MFDGYKSRCPDAGGVVPHYLLRDRDAIYGTRFRRCVEKVGIEQIVTSPLRAMIATVNGKTAGETSS